MKIVTNLRRLLFQRLSSKGGEWNRCLWSVEGTLKAKRLEPSQAVPTAGNAGRLDHCRATFTLLASLFLNGCRGAPSINLLGSFFPGWMLCMGLGLVGTLVFRQVFIKTNVESHLVPRPLVYLCLWGLVTLSSWLLFFRN